MPAAPQLVLGVIDVGGRVLPVFDTRARFGLQRRPLDPSDHLLLARTAGRPVALVIDAAHGLIDQPADSMVEAVLLTRGLDHIRGVLARDDGLVLIHDLEQFLTTDETCALNRALPPEARHAG